MKKKILLQDIVDYIAQHEGLNSEDAETFVRSFFDIVEQGLQEDKIVKIKGLGTFKLVAVSERESVNINTGERFQIEGHSKISFTPDNSMKELINRPFAHFEAVELNDDTDTEEFNEVDKEIESEFENIDEEADEEEDEPSDAEDEKSDGEEDFSNEKNLEDELAVNDSTEVDKSLTEKADAIGQETTDSVQKENEVTFIVETANESSNVNLPSEQESEKKETLSEPIEVSENILGPTVQQEEQKDASQSTETTQPMTIAPMDLAESEDKQETAKVRIDSNDDENDIDINTKSELENKPNHDHSESPDNTEEEIIVTTPQPLTSDTNMGQHTSNTMGYAYVEVPTRRKVNWWKRIVLAFLFIMMLIISYLAGYYKLLCPCTLHTPQQELQANSNALPQDTALSLTKDSTEQEVTTSLTENEGRENLESEATPNKASVPDERTSSATTTSSNLEENQATKQSTEKPVKANNGEQLNKKFSQSDTRNQTAPSKVKTHTVKVGDTLYKIARKYYGSEQAINKIIKYNNLKDADNIQLGMELKIP